MNIVALASHAHPGRITRNCGGQSRHLRPHQRAMCRVQVQKSTGGVVPTASQIARQKCVHMSRAMEGIEISEQKRDLVGYIDPAQGGVEFEAVERSQSRLQT